MRGKKIVRRNLIAIIAFFLFSNCILFAQQGTKVGYIDSQSILTQLPEAIKAQGDVQAAIDKIKAQIDSIGQVYQTTLADYQKQANLMTDTKKRDAQQKIMNMEKDYNDLRAKLDANGEVALLNRKLMSPIVDKIKAAVEDVAKQAGVQLVLEKSEQLQVIWFAEASMDLTFKVLDKLKTGK
jgi:outer membrane protein